MRQIKESPVADIILRSPFAELRRLMDEAWDGERRPWGLQRLADLPFIEAGTLAVDVEETDGHYQVTASVPGFQRDQIKIHVGDGTLTIAAERTEEREEQERNLVRRERYAGSLTRRVAIPGIGPSSEVEARLKEGVLSVSIAAPEAQQAKQIEIQEG
jgi:HSP20 family protein